MSGADAMVFLGLFLLLALVFLLTDTKRPK